MLRNYLVKAVKIETSLILKIYHESTSQHKATIIQCLKHLMNYKNLHADQSIYYYMTIYNSLNEVVVWLFALFVTLTSIV